MRRDLLKCQLEGSSSNGRKTKEEEVNVALASKGHQEQHMRKKDLSKDQMLLVWRDGTLCHTVSF